MPHAAGGVDEESIDSAFDIFSDSSLLSEDMSETREVRRGVAAPAKGRKNTKRPVTSRGATGSGTRASKAKK
eukprot:2801574-Pleurochrysis_carterae.AAC.1